MELARSLRHETLLKWRGDDGFIRRPGRWSALWRLPKAAGGESSHEATKSEGVIHRNCVNLLQVEHRDAIVLSKYPIVLSDLWHRFVNEL
jgi:hypothetical protein